MRDIEDFGININACSICNNIEECINAVDLVAILTETLAYKDLGKDLSIYDGRGINKEAKYTIGK